MTDILHIDFSYRVILGLQIEKYPLSQGNRSVVSTKQNPVISTNGRNLASCTVQDFSLRSK